MSKNGFNIKSLRDYDSPIDTDAMWADFESRQKKSRRPIWWWWFGCALLLLSATAVWRLADWSAADHHTIGLSEVTSLADSDESLLAQSESADKETIVQESRALEQKQRASHQPLGQDIQSDIKTTKENRQTRNNKPLTKTDLQQTISAEKKINAPVTNSENLAIETANSFKLFSKAKTDEENKISSSSNIGLAQSSSDLDLGLDVTKSSDKITEKLPRNTIDLNQLFTSVSGLQLIEQDLDMSLLMMPQRRDNRPARKFDQASTWQIGLRGGTGLFTQTNAYFIADRETTLEDMIRTDLILRKQLKSGISVHAGIGYLQYNDLSQGEDIKMDVEQGNGIVEILITSEGDSISRMGEISQEVTNISQYRIWNRQKFVTVPIGIGYTKSISGPWSLSTVLELAPRLRFNDSFKGIGTGIEQEVFGGQLKRVGLSAGVGAGLQYSISRVDLQLQGIYRQDLISNQLSENVSPRRNHVGIQLSAYYSL